MCGFWTLRAAAPAFIALAVATAGCRSRHAPPAPGNEPTDASTREPSAPGSATASALRKFPVIEWTRRAEIKGDSFVSPRGDAVWAIVRAGAGEKVVAHAFDPSSPDEEILAVPHAVGKVGCSRGLELCVVEDANPDDPRASQGLDARTIYIVDRKAHTTRKLDGPWSSDRKSGARIADRSVSEAGDFIVVRWADPKTNLPALYVVDATRKVRGPVTSDGELLAPVATRGVGPSTRFIVRRGDVRDKPTYLLLDPTTLTTTPTNRPPEVGNEGPAPLLSPDGKHLASCVGRGRILIKAVETDTTRSIGIGDGESLTNLGGEAVANCVRWLTARYLLYVGATLRFVDIEAMTTSMALRDPNDVATNLEVSPDFRWAVDRGREGVRIGNIVMQ